MFMEKPCIQILDVESGWGEREERRREGEKLVYTTHRCGSVPCGSWASDIQEYDKGEVHCQPRAASLMNTSVATSTRSPHLAHLVAP
ncbi:hypothetical protein VN97_g12619 [Penicillium thymicola]|uniref:Uncharacterized protein n=1 Tax=Penicillium thymicola TaxID=293382 RepID=A0AAI9X2E7_PENTH|nr:hypothetical protein VN97_g12619 [Penicillium thymicola]